jgi:hypothetical protein
MADALLVQHRNGLAILERINGEYSELRGTTFSAGDDQGALTRWRGWATLWIRETEALLGSDSLAIGQFRSANAGPASTPVGHSIAWGGIRGTMEAKLEALRQIIEKRQSIGGTTTVVVHGVVGNLNTGTVIGDLKATVSTLHQGGQADLARLMEQLVDGLVKTKHLADRERGQALELARAMAEEVAKPAEHRSLTVIETVASRLGTIVAKAADLASIWRAIVAWFGGDSSGSV